MKRYLAVFAAAALLLLQGCDSIKPLTLRHYSKNIIANKDRTLFIGQDQIDFNNLKQELVQRLISTTTAITVHIHKDLPASAAEALMNRLKMDGYKDVQMVLFRD
jgi:biopolymer transport protein ExbD